MKKRSIIAAVIFVVVVLGVIVYFLSFKDFTPNTKTPSQNKTLPNGQVFNFDGSIDEWRAKPVTFSLTPQVPKGRNGGVWVNQTDQGLVVAGKVLGTYPKWPKSANDDMALFDHVEVWIADDLPVEMPLIGWANQFGDNYLKKAEECYDSFLVDEPLLNSEKCEVWFDQQGPYRELFKKLFVRQWQIAPSAVKETFASNAFNSLGSFPNQGDADSIQTDLMFLRPATTTPLVQFNSTDDGYTFEILIPWNVFPPMHGTEIKDLRLMVDVYSPGSGRLKYGPYSSTAQARVYGDPTTFNRFSLDVPWKYTLEACKFDPNEYGVEMNDTYFNPAREGGVDLFIIENKPLGYQYSPSLTQNSPSVRELPYFSKSVGGGEYVCGTELSYSNASTTIESKFYIEPNFEFKKLPNGDLLIKQGPDTDMASWLGTGTCGACDIVTFSMYYIDISKGKIIDSVNFEPKNISTLGDVRYEVSSDWKKITRYDANKPYDEYDEEEVRWDAEAYCFNNVTHLYDICGRKTNVPPPQSQ